MKGNVLIFVVIIVVLLGGAGFSVYMMLQTKAELTRKEEDLKASEEKNKKIAGEVQNAVAVKAEVGQKLKETENKLKAAAGEIEKKNTEYAALELKAQALEKGKKSAEDKANKASADNKKLGDELKKEKAKTEELTRTAARLKKEAEDKDKKIKTTDTLIKNLSAKVKEYEQEKKDLTEAKNKLDKVSSSRSAWRGVVLLESGKPQDAAKEFEKAVEQDPSNAQAQKGLALAYEAVGEKTKAAAAWENFIKTGPERDELNEAREHIKNLKE
jgi:tetratricopeptide (TPR) repeat protein